MAPILAGLEISAVEGLVLFLRIEIRQNFRKYGNVAVLL
jgi:hypothetical protein